MDDWRGWDFVQRDNDPTNDGHGHGTHVAGTIAARGDDGVGVVGVAFTARLMPLRVLGDSGTGSISAIADAFAYAGRSGVRVVNASLGWTGGRSRAVADAIAASPRTLFVVAAGNAGLDLDAPGTDAWPCEYAAELPNVLCVAATDQRDRLAAFSNRGGMVGIAAPGVNIRSTLPHGAYGNWQGTSMAAPHVSGAAALVWSLRPDETPAAVRADLEAAADLALVLRRRRIKRGALDLDLRQKSFARYIENRRAFARKEGLDLPMPDYRDLPEDQPYDKIASIGMFEHVGRARLPTYFPKIQRYEASIYMLGWGVPTFDALYSLQSLVRSVGAGGDGNYNVGRYSNPQMDALVERVKVEVDQKRRAELIEQALILEHKDVSHLPLHNQVIPWAMKKNIEVVHRADNRLDWRLIAVK